MSDAGFAAESADFVSKKGLARKMRYMQSKCSVILLNLRDVPSLRKSERVPA